MKASYKAWECRDAATVEFLQRNLSQARLDRYPYILTIVYIKMIVHSCFRTLFCKITLKSEWLPRSQMSFHSDSGVSIALGLTFWPYMMFTLFLRVLHVGPIDAPVRGQPAFDPWDNMRAVLDSVNVQAALHVPTVLLHWREYGGHEEQSCIPAVHAEQAPFAVRHQEVWTEWGIDRLRTTCGDVCRQGSSYPQRYGSGTRCSDEVVEGGQRPQQELPPLRWQLLHKASVGERAECCEHFVDRHSSPQLEGPTCAARPARHRRERQLPQWRHVAGTYNYRSGDMLLIATTTAVATCCW